MNRFRQRATLWSVFNSPLAAFTEGAPRIIRLGELDHGRSVQLRRGDELVITLEGNPTTGYEWQVAAGDFGVLRPLVEPQFAPESEAPGAPGKFTLRFEAAAAGQTVLELIYRRSFEAGLPPQKAISVAVEVQ